MMGHREKLISGDECDAIASHGKYRRYYCYLGRSGVVNAIKTKLMRRARHEANMELRRHNSAVGSALTETLNSL